MEEEQAKEQNDIFYVMKFYQSQQQIWHKVWKQKKEKKKEKYIQCEAIRSEQFENENFLWAFIYELHV